MKTVAVRPSSWAASATPCAWLPALAATTPRAFSSGDSRLIRVYAPRILNEPARWRFSHLRCTGPPTRSDSARLYSSGVGRTTPASTSRAARTSSRVTGEVVVDMAGGGAPSRPPRGGGPPAPRRGGGGGGRPLPRGGGPGGGGPLSPAARS